MRFELFNQRLLGRYDIVAVDMIHYSGLWGVCFSHHLPNNNHARYAADTTTEGVLRFLGDTLGSGDDASFRALADYTITTHHIDADALLPVWSLLNPQLALEHRELLERVARCGDFFIYLDDESARLNFIIEALQLKLRESGQRGERLINDDLTARCFEWLLPRWAGLLKDPAPGADLWEAPMREMQADIQYLSAAGRVTELWDHHTSLVETDRKLDAHALNTACRNDLLLVWRAGSPRRRIDLRPAIGWYDIQSMPNRPRYDLAALAEQLNAAEQKVGHAPQWRYDQGPAWLRAPASGLNQEQTLEVLKQWLDAEPETHVSQAYRADVQQVFRELPRHAIFTSHRRFADAAEVCFVPGAAYAGLYLVPGFHIRISGYADEISGDSWPITRQLAAQHDEPILFAVSDDFYWNRRAPERLELQVTYVDHGAGSFWIEYDTWGDPFKPTEAVVLSGDGATRTATIRLDDARLGNSQDWADLRLARAKGTLLEIREMRLRKLGAE
jgi:hypothetical protein